MVVIDTDVLFLAFAFHEDERQGANAEFLNRVRTQAPALTVYNLMEVLGKLSFNLSPSRLDQWQSWLIDANRLTVVWPADPADGMSPISFRSEILEEPLRRMRQHRMAFMDALVLGLAERTANVEHLVTWNARHFQGKTPLSVVTPAEYLALPAQ